MLFALTSLFLMSSAAAVPGGQAFGLDHLDCPITKAIYLQPNDPDWTIGFTKPKHAPTASSDLLMTVSGIDFVRDFAFASAQGFGGTSLLVTEDDQEAGQPMAASDQPDDPMAFHAFRIDAAGGLSRISDAPMADSDAPVAIYIPDVSRYFWYDEHYVDNETGKIIPEPIDMAQGLFLGTCLK